MGEWENAKVAVPDGAYPLFLTLTTQTNFHCREREECTVERPYVFVSKKTFLDDIQFRGVISDFHPTKKLIEAYPDGVDEQEDGTSGLLVVWDEEEDYGQNFYLVHKVELKEQIIAKYEAAQHEVESTTAGGERDEAAEDEYVAPVSRPWVSQGSEMEIAEEKVMGSRPCFAIRAVRSRARFGRKYNFTDRDAHEDPCIGEGDCRPYKDPNFELRRREQTAGVQALPAAASASTQTTWHRIVSKCLQYTPLDRTPQDCEDMASSPSFRSFLEAVRDLYEVALQQNETVDIVEDDFSALAEEEAGLGNKSDSELRELQSFSHLNYCAGRIIAATDWQPLPRALVVGVSCAQRLNFEERVAVAGKVHTGYVLLWNFSDPISPQFVLHAPGDVLAFKFCPSNPDLVVGGVASGQVIVWDLGAARTAALELRAITGDEGKSEEGDGGSIVAKPAYLSAVDMSHTSAVTDVAWLPSTFELSERGKVSVKTEPKRQELFATMAGDGAILFWDIGRARELSRAPIEGEENQKKKKEGWGPTYRMPLIEPTSGAQQRGVLMTIESPETAEEPAKVVCATEEGDFVTASLANPGTEAGPRGVNSVLRGHCAPCMSLSKSPFVRGVYLTVGDWTFSVWRDGLTAPLLSSPIASSLLTCGCWSPTRPGVMVIGKVDGGLDVWDLMDRSHEPSVSLSVASAAITSLQFHVSGSKQLLAIGDDAGTVHVMDVPRNLRRLASHEKTFVANFFAREAKRVSYVHGQTRLLREPTPDGQPRQTEVDSPPEDVEEAEAEVTARLEADFLQSESKFLKEMGLSEPPPVEVA